MWIENDFVFSCRMYTFFLNAWNIYWSQGLYWLTVETSWKNWRCGREKNSCLSFWIFGSFSGHKFKKKIELVKFITNFRMPFNDVVMNFPILYHFQFFSYQFFNRLNLFGKCVAFLSTNSFWMTFLHLSKQKWHQR